MRSGIALKLNGIVLLVVLALGAALGSFFLAEERATLVDERERRIGTAGLQYSRDVELDLSRGDIEAIDRTLKGAALDEEVAYVIVKSLSGEIVAARWVGDSRGNVAERLFPLRRLPVRAGKGEAPHPFGEAWIGEGGEVIGHLAVGIDSSPMKAALRRILLRTLVAVPLFALAASVAGFFAVRFLLRRSVDPLVSGIREIAAGDLSHRLRLEGGDEISEIGRAFDGMTETLSRTLVTKEELLREVDARTAELRETLAERIRMQEGLAEREERIRLLLESTAESIVGIDPDGSCTFCNPACLRTLGYASQEDLIGEDLHRLLHEGKGFDPGHAGKECPILSSVRAGEGSHVEEDRFLKADGRALEVEYWSYPLFRGGKVAGAVVTFLDVTERRRLEKELLKMKNLESIGLLAGGIAHDFNNFLSGILGNISLARTVGGVPPEAQGKLDRAEKATLRARELTQQLLTFSKGGTPVKKILQPDSLVRDAVEFALSGSRVVGEYRCPEGIWSVEADEGQLNQLFQNLAINSVQAMPDGGTVRVACANALLDGAAGIPLPPGRYVRVTVADEGIGIPREHLARIFDPYFSTKKGGNGLGLAMVYSILRKHGGYVSVDSEPGKGTEFEVFLPASDKSPVEASPGAVPVGKGKGRVLVLDDEEMLREVAADMLAGIGYRAECVADGREAVSAYRRAREAGNPFDAVLLDLTVPGGMGGEETLRELRSVDPAVCAIVSSGYSHDRVMAAFREYGFRGMVSKPYRLQDLAAALAAALESPPPPAGEGGAYSHPGAPQG